MNDSQPPSNMQIMLALLAKDRRFFRVPMIALLIVGIGCYLVSNAAIFVTNTAHEPVGFLYGSSLFAIFLTTLLAAVFGGISIAVERADRTADFLAMLPVRRTQIVFSKWLVSLFMLGLWSAVHGLIALSMLPGRNLLNSFELATSIAPGIAQWMGMNLSLFGIAWLFSTFTQSGPISACASIALTVSITFLAEACMVALSPTTAGRSLGVGFVTFTVGLASLIAGAIYYRKRIAP